MRKGYLFFGILLLSCLRLTAQDYGYFGKKNMISVHGAWFFRAMPQVFYDEPMYHYKASSGEFKQGFFRNHVWTTGVSYKRILNQQQAFGFQLDLNTRNLASPNFDLSSSRTFISPWNHNISSQSVWSENLERFVRISDMAISKTNLLNRQLLLTYSRSRTTTIFPIGLTSTLGLGVQYATLNTSANIHARAQTSNQMDGPWGGNKQLFHIQNPIDLKNDYLACAWMWDLSLNYALSNNLIFSISSDMRGVFGVFRITKQEALDRVFGDFENDVPSLEAFVLGRNMRKEIGREMRFQNTLRFGLSFLF